MKALQAHVEVLLEKLRDFIAQHGDRSRKTGKDSQKVIEVSPLQQQKEINILPQTSPNGKISSRNPKYPSIPSRQEIITSYPHRRYFTRSVSKEISWVIQIEMKGGLEPSSTNPIKGAMERKLDIRKTMLQEEREV
jgi:hypothetical protein